MSVVWVYSSPESERYILVRGHVGGWFRGQRIPALRTPMHGGWWLRHERTADVMAKLDAAGYLVRFVDGTAPPYVPELFTAVNSYGDERVVA